MTKKEKKEKKRAARAQAAANAVLGEMRDWKAIRYALDSLSADDVEEFEQAIHAAVRQSLEKRSPDGK